MGPWNRRCTAGAAAITFSLAASGCSSGTKQAGSATIGGVTAPTSGPVTTPGSGTTSPATSGPVSSSTRAPASSVPASSTPTGSGACPPGQLGVVLPAVNGAGGTGIYSFVATNNGPRPCSLGGYFGVSLYDPAGHLLTTQDSRQSTTPSGAGAQSVILDPGAKASFTVGVPENPVGKQTSCPVIGAFHLIPPNDTGFVQVSLTGTRPTYCGSNGVEVYPTRPGTSG